MDSADDERLEELVRAVARLQERQADLTRRLERIERAAFARPIARPAPPVDTPPVEVPAPPPRPQFETRMGLTWVNRIGAITLVLGVGFFFKYAIDNRWIGETGRVLLGILAGIAALGAADILWRRNQGIFSQGVSGVGIAVLYLSVYAAYAFYHLATIAPAFAVMALTTALAGALAWRYDAAAIAALGLFGGYATPLLLTTGRDRPWFFFGYLLILNMGAVAIARIRKWTGLEWLALIATAYLFGVWVERNFSPPKQLVATLFALAFYGLFAGSRIRPIVYAAQVAVNVGIAAFWMEIVGPYPLLALALAGAGLGIADRRHWPRAVLVSWISFWLSYRVWTFKSPPHPLPALAILSTGAFVLFFAWIPWREVIRKALTREDYLLLPLNGASYFAVMFGLLHAAHREYLGPLAVALALAHFAAAFRLRESDVKWLAAGVGSAFATLAIPIQFSGFRITMAWALEAAAIAWIGKKAGARTYAYAAWAVFAPTLVRLVVFDSGVPGKLRFLAFATVAVSLWLSSKWLGGGRLSLGTYTAGHVVMLWGLILEVLSWAGRTASRENLQSMESASISILMAAYAVVLVTVGVLTRTAANRIGGLGLIGVVVMKLYLYDVWLLVRIYRVLAFAALGGLLLLTSYLYSRYRMSIENWWSDRKKA